MISSICWRSPHDALALASKRYGHGDAGEARPADRLSRETLPASYPESCFSHRRKTDYFAKRGLSDATVTRFRLGYDPEHDCVILPCENGRCVRRAVAEKRYLNEKGQPSPLFQPELLTAGGEEPVFLLEGAFDALSAEELGYRAAALNGAGNREKAAALLRGLDRPAPILLLTDNDAAGNAWAAALAEEFPWLYRCPGVPTGKDLNEFLCADREGAARFLAQAVEDHRASSKHEPRSIYGLIVSEADRQLDPMTVLRRTVQYGLANYPELDEAGQLERAHSHVAEKYGEGGYLKLRLSSAQNAAALAEIRRLLANRGEFDEICRSFMKK